ncbi:MAG: ribonuclease Z [Lachnospiraceae bacterium]|nr:ribonuclease Z [Lachnospiraceae bacterium]
MRLIVCIDEKDGIRFNHRRQSRDKVLLEDVLELAGGSRLWMNAYSAGLFWQYGLERPLKEQVCEDFLMRAEAGDYCFVEQGGFEDCLDEAEQVILYGWNRHYPADVHFDRSRLAGWKLEETREFAGSSHEKITREVYVR